MSEQNTTMSPVLSKEELTDLRQMVLRKEQPSLERIRAAVHTLREGRISAANVKAVKAKKKEAKAASGGKVDVDKIFSQEPGE